MADELNPAHPGMAFSPKLREAMQEILAITRKHDIGAYVLLVDKEHSEDRTRFPTWSVVQIESYEGRSAIHIQTKGRPREHVTWTLNILDALFKQSAAMALNMGDVLRDLKKHWNFKTTSWKGPEAPPWDSR